MEIFVLLLRQFIDMLISVDFFAKARKSQRVAE